jgi:hypothetical protein
MNLSDKNKVIANSPKPATGKYKVIVDEDHVGNSVAEAIDELTHRLEKVFGESGKKQDERILQLLELISQRQAVENKNNENNCPLQYIITVSERDDAGRILKMTATPESVK